MVVNKISRYSRTILPRHIEIADVERVIFHLQGDLDYYKKTSWSLEVALKKEENILKKLQREYREEFKHRGGKTIEDN